MAIGFDHDQAPDEVHQLQRLPERFRWMLCNPRAVLGYLQQFFAARAGCGRCLLEGQPAITSDVIRGCFEADQLGAVKISFLFGFGVVPVERFEKRVNPLPEACETILQHRVEVGDQVAYAGDMIEAGRIEHDAHEVAFHLIR